MDNNEKKELEQRLKEEIAELKSSLSSNPGSIHLKEKLKDLKDKASLEGFQQLADQVDKLLSANELKINKNKKVGSSIYKEDDKNKEVEKLEKDIGILEKELDKKLKEIKELQKGLLEAKVQNEQVINKIIDSSSNKVKETLFLYCKNIEEPNPKTENEVKERYNNLNKKEKTEFKVGAVQIKKIKQQESNIINTIKNEVKEAKDIVSNLQFKNNKISKISPEQKAKAEQRAKDTDKKLKEIEKIEETTISNRPKFSKLIKNNKPKEKQEHKQSSCSVYSPGPTPNKPKPTNRGR